MAPGERLTAFAAAVNERLPALIPPANARPERVHSAMHAALTSPGKRLRPVLTLAVAEMFGGLEDPALDLGCAVEMVHACSLVLDDLPAMDDAALRRGQPTVHRVYGEDIAILAAMALLNRAFAVVSEAGSRMRSRRYAVADLGHHLAAAIGTDGLIGGQALDLEARGPGKSGRMGHLGLPGLLNDAPIGLERLEYIHSHKTGALFLAAAELGAMAAGAKRRDLEMVTEYAKNLGLAFQISDDLLDVTATPEQTGKDSGQDVDKTTFVKLLGIPGARALEGELLEFSIAAIAPLGAKAAPLRALAELVRHRAR